MDPEADASREYERLRAELADFVLDALAERIAAGREPVLSKALVDAIDKRVDASVQERLASSVMPDPHEFADAVLAAAAGRGGDRLSTTVGRARSGESKASVTKAAARAPRLSTLQIALLALIGAALIVLLTVFVLRGTSPAPTVFEKNVQSNEFQELPPTNEARIESDSGTAAGSATNVQGGTR